MEAFRVPGLALGIVKGRRTIFAGGLGLADIRRDLPVTAETPFLIGSCTKAFTALAVGILVDEGTAGWDVPVRNYLSELRMHDPVATERLTLRDLLCHRSGLPNHFGARPSRRRGELIGMLPYLEPAREFRSGHVYCNKGYILAGLVLERLAGLSWEQFVRRRVFRPLGMRDSGFAAEMTATASSACRGNVFATGHAEQRRRIVPWLRGWSGKLDLATMLRSIGPDGTIVSSVRDMCRWLALHVSGGRTAGGAAISPRSLRECHTPQIVTPSFYGDWPELLDASYGLGWRIQPYRGHRCIFHGGGGSGYTARVTFLPAESLGVVVLTNLEASPAPEVLTFGVLDRLLGLSRIRWQRRFDDRQRDRAAGSRPRAADRAKRDARAPSLPLERYAGIYHHPGYGRLRVHVEKGRLKACHVGWPYELMQYTLVRLSGGAFGLSGPVGADVRRAEVRFRLAGHSRVRSLAVPFEPLVGDIVFRRLPEPGTGRRRARAARQKR